MKLSESTINVLKNFATINAGMQFKEGSVVRTISKGQNVLGKATVTENFEKDFVIYDLNRFLSLCGSLEDPRCQTTSILDSCRLLSIENSLQHFQS